MVKLLAFTVIMLGTSSMLSQVNLYSSAEDSLLSRYIIYKAPINEWLRRNRQLLHQETMTYNICINRNGEVVNADIIQSETSITDKTILSDALEAINKLLFKTNLEAPKIQCIKYKRLNSHITPQSSTNLIAHQSTQLNKTNHSKSSKQLKAPPTTIYLAQDGCYWLLNTVVSIDEIEKGIQKLRTIQPVYPIKVIIDIDPRVPNHYVTAIMNIASKYSVETILTNP